MQPYVGIALMSLLSGLVNTGVFYVYGRSVNKHKGKAFRPALSVGIATAIATAVTTTATFAMTGGSVAGLGGRMGIYIPEPKVTKYPAFQGTQYYS